jgi:hypothetical protein
MKLRFLNLWPIFCIIALWVIFSSPYFVKGLVPFPSTYLATFFPPWNTTYGMPVKNNAMPDTISQIYPWKKLTIDTWKTGAVPLWNPYSFSGTAHAANYQSAIFSPLNLLFFVLPFVDAWSIMVLLQPLLSGIGIYLFLRSIDRTRAGACIGAIAFMFCGFITVWMAYGTLGYAASFLPWILWGVASDFRKKSFFSRLVVAFGVAASFLSGHFQISLYVLGAVSAFIIFRSLQTRRFKQGLVLFLYAFSGLLLAAPQILLTLDAYRASTRSADFIKAEIIPWQYIVTLFAPDFYGNPVTRNDWFGHYAEWSSYIGVVPLVLCLFSIRKKIKGDTLFLLLLALTAILLAYPTPLNDLLFRLRLPAISTSAASRIMVILSFSLSCLSAFGMDQVADLWEKKDKRGLFVFAGLILLVVGVLWGIVLIGRPFPADKLLVAKRNLTLPTLFTFIALILMAAGFIKNKFIRSGVIICFVFISMFDAYRYASKWMPFDSRAYVYPPEKSLTFLKSRVGSDRVFGNIGNEVGGMFGLPLIEGYDAMYQGRYAEFMNAVSTGHIEPGERSVVQFDKYGIYRMEALQLLGVRYIYHRLSDGRNIWAFPYWEYTDDGVMKQVYQDEKYWIYEYTRAFPRAFLASKYTVEKGKEEIIKTLFSKDFDRRESIVLEEKPVIDPKPGPGTANITSYQPNAVTVHTHADSPKLLFLSDAFDTGWRASVDGKAVVIHRADYDFRAVEVPKGDHVVRFEYLPRSFIVGVIISGLMCVVLIVSRFLL